MSDVKQEKKSSMADFQIILKPLIKFLTINVSLLLLIILVAIRNNQNIEPNSPSAALFILLIFSLLIVFPITFYLFQKKVALLKKTPYKIIRMGPYFLRLLQFYVIQYLILLAILIGLVIISALMTAIIKQSNPILTPIITFCFIVFGIYWFYRLFFAPYILIFQRSNYAAGNIIIESKFLIKKNITFIILIILLPILVSIPSFIKVLNNHGVPQISYSTLIISILTHIVSYAVCILITVNEVNRNTDFASELIKTEEKLTTAST